MPAAGQCYFNIFFLTSLHFAFFLLDLNMASLLLTRYADYSHQILLYPIPASLKMIRLIVFHD
jgi:hypothetical protein